MDSEPEQAAVNRAETVVSRRRAVRRLRRAEIFYLTGLAAFAVLALFAHIDSYFSWDLRITNALQSFNAQGILTFMRGVSVVGDGWYPYALAVLTVFILFAARLRSEAAGLALSTGGGALVNTLLKILIARPRPAPNLVTVFRAMNSRSFPSGHVTFYVCYFGFLFFVAYALLPRGSIARRSALALAALPVALVGLSRVYLGEHWPSDTLGGYLFSGLWLALSLHAYRHWKNRATFNVSQQAKLSDQR